MVNSDKPAPKKRRKAAPALDKPAASQNGSDTASEANAEPLLDQARREKIAGIKKALEDGTYRVSSEDVARKLIEHMLQPKK